MADPPNIVSAIPSITVAPCFKMMPISVIIRCVECITETSIDHVVIVDRFKPKEEPFPFNAFLKLIEAYCERPISALFLVHREEFEDYKTNVLNELKERYLVAIAEYYRDHYKQRYAASNLQKRIKELSRKLEDKDVVLAGKNVEISRLRANEYAMERLINRNKKLEDELRGRSQKYEPADEMKGLRALKQKLINSLGIHGVHAQEAEEVCGGARELRPLKESLLESVGVDLRDKGHDSDEPLGFDDGNKTGETHSFNEPLGLGGVNETEEDRFSHRSLWLDGAGEADEDSASHESLWLDETNERDENHSSDGFWPAKKSPRSQCQEGGYYHMYSHSTHSARDISTSPPEQISNTPRMTDIALIRANASKGMPNETTEVAQGAIKSSCGGLDGADERDDPYANLRYPFQVDLLKGKSQALVGGEPSGKDAGRSEQNLSLGAGSPPGIIQLPIGVLSTQGITPRSQELRRSQGLYAKQEDLHRGRCSSTTISGGLSGLVDSSLTLEDLVANWHPPVGRDDNSGNGDVIANETPRAVGSKPQSTRTVSPLLRYGVFNPPPAASPQMSPPPRHLVSQAFDHHASLKAKPFPRTSWASKPKPAPRAFAPGLAPRKPKVDYYDPMGLTLPKQPFSMAVDLIGPDVRGSWTTFDKDANVRGFDKLWHMEQNKDRSANGAENIGGFKSGVSGITTASSSGTITHTPDGNRKFEGSKEPSNEKPDDIFENPDLDVDEDIRKKFLSVKELMIERSAPGSLREHRNPFLRQSASSAPTTVVIGGKVAKVLKPEADRRSEFQDRFGNYVGINLGRMKKHLVQDRQMKIKLREEEIVEATKQKRAFEALGPEERDIALAKRRPPVGAALADVFEFTDTSGIYFKSMAETVSTLSARSTPLPHQSKGKLDASISNREMSSSNGSDFHPIEEFDGFDLTHKNANRSVSVKSSHQLTPISGASNSTAKATGANTVRIGMTRKLRVRKIQATVSSTDPSGTPSLVDEDPDLAHIEDVEDMPGEFIPENNEEKADVWSNLCLSSSTRGRVVSVNVHDTVQFTSEAVMERIFGGIIQEVQFHPKERIALVVFIFPAEAEDFVKHVKTMKESSAQEYRRLQIDVNWYKSSEHHAVYPVKHQIAMRVIGEDATRVIGVNGIPLQRKKEDVNKELNIYLGKVVVKVSLITPSKRYVQERDGKMAVIEFASIKDAIEAKRRFSAGLIYGYQSCSVKWLKDSCDKPAVKQPWCSCATCASL